MNKVVENISHERKLVFGARKNLFLLPFDHRSSFQRDVLGIVDRNPTSSEVEVISGYKRIIYQGFLYAMACGAPQSSSGILVDEKFGAPILTDARERGYLTACCVEKSGQEEFDFEYGNSFKRHISTVNPDFVKTLVRYNPDQSSAGKDRQLNRLRRLSDFCREKDFLFMFELLVPASGSQLVELGNNLPKYESEVRPHLMKASMQEIQNSGVEPDIWKVEGVETLADYEALAKQARSNGRDDVALIVLGRGKDEVALKQWLSLAAQTKGFEGFAIGRTIWENPIKKLSRKEVSEQEAIEQIGDKFKMFCDFWLNSRQDTASTKPIQL